MKPHMISRPFILLTAFLVVGLAFAGDAQLVPESPKVISPEMSISGEPRTDLVAQIDFDVYLEAPHILPDHRRLPEFPDSARRAGAAGKVAVELYVNNYGAVMSPRIWREKPLGLNFGEAVMSVISTWRFTPAMQQGKPIGVWKSIKFTFDPESDSVHVYIPDYSGVPAARMGM
jgi:TonB family protein